MNYNVFFSSFFSKLQRWWAVGTAEARTLAPGSNGRRLRDGQLAQSNAQVFEHDFPAGKLRQRAGHDHAARAGPGQGSAVQSGPDLPDREHL